MENGLVTMIENDSKKSSKSYNPLNPGSDIPPNWSWVKLSDMIEKISTTGIKLKQKEYLVEGKYPVVDQGQELVGGYSNNDSLIVNTDLPIIIFGDHTKVKKFIDFKFIAGADGVIVIKPKKEFFPKLFFYFLHCIQFPDKGYARHFQYVEKETIPLPPLPEQKKIVEKIEELFSQLDSGVASLKKAKEQIRLYRQSVLAAAFSGRLTGELRKKEMLKAAEPKVKYNNTELPDGWKWVKNNDLLKYVTSGSRDWKRYYSSDGSFFIRTQDINTNRLMLDKCAFVKLPEKVEGKRSLVEEGDLLMTITGANVGKVAIVDFPIKDAYVSQSVALLKYLDKKNAKYLWYYFQAPEFGKTFIEKLVYGMGRPVLSLENMREVEVLMCPYEVQVAIISEIEIRFSEADNLEKAIDESLAKSETLRQSILKQAFEGRLIK